MVRIFGTFLLACFLAATVAAGAPADATDPFLWLEAVHGARALAWVKEQNAKSLGVLQADPHYAEFFSEALAIAQTKDRIPYPALRNGWVYNFWQDATHVRGIWRRTSRGSYATATPRWTTVLDLDALARAEHANWVWAGANCEEPSERRCLVALSNGGEDAQTLREFDLATRRFVPGGFVLPHAKQSATWLDRNTLLVARPWKPGQVTRSSYPYVVKELKRGQPLSAAVEVFHGSPSDVEAFPFRLHDGAGHAVTMIGRGLTFFTTEYEVFTPRGLRRLNVPLKSTPVGLVDGRLLVKLDQDWTAGGRHFAQGSLVALALDAVLADPGYPKPQLVYAPGPRETLEDVATTKSALLLVVYKNVRARALLATPLQTGWRTLRLDLPDNASIDIDATSVHSNTFYVDAVGFLSPTTLYEGSALTGKVAAIKHLRSQFDASHDVVEQHEAISKDGTRIPYFIVHPKHMVRSGKNPTVLYAYGGFQISMTPYYSGILGKLWLSRGGVYVLANIRGGGEFGPAWHEAAIKTHRQRSFDDFYAVAKDLVARKVTSPRYLGIQGGSNGGLLMGVEFTQHPQMWRAVDMQVPLLDMLRYQQLDAGESWVGEYGSVHVPAERAFLAKISPYNNLHAGVAYPEPLIWTTTKDDRVGPQQARKFAAKLESLGDRCLFYEVTEGGHAAGENLRERAKTDALEWTYFTLKLVRNRAP